MGQNPGTGRCQEGDERTSSIIMQRTLGWLLRVLIPGPALLEGGRGLQQLCDFTQGRQMWTLTEEVGAVNQPDCFWSTEYQTQSYMRAQIPLEGYSLQESSERGDWAKAELTPGKPTTLSTWRPAYQHAPDIRESSPKPISDQLPKNTFAYPISPSMSPNSRRLRP